MPMTMRIIAMSLSSSVVPLNNMMSADALGGPRRLEAARHCEGFASVLGTLELSGCTYV